MKSSRHSILQICSVEFTFKQFIYQLCTSLVSNNWMVSASFTPDIDTKPDFSLSEDRISFLPSSFYRSIRFHDLRRTWVSLIRLFSADDSRLVHVHTPLLSYLVRFQFYFPFWRRQRKLIYTVHGFYFHPNGSCLSNLVHGLLELLLLPSCDLVFFVSKYDFSFASPYLRLLNIRYAYIGNGVCTKLFSPGNTDLRSLSCLPSPISLPKNSFVIGFVGRFVPEKGLLDLFEAFRLFHSIYPDSVLLLVGNRLDSDYDSSISPALQNLLISCPNSVFCTGMIKDKPSLVSLYRSMNIFCLPSYREGLPTSLIEAMACGLPVVGTSIRGSSQLISHEITGLLVPPQSPPELFSAFCQLRSQPDLMSSISANARSLILRDYSIDNCLELQCSELSKL